MMRQWMALLHIGVLLLLLLKVEATHRLKASLNMAGLKADIYFDQASSSQPVVITYQSNTTISRPWAIHEYPFVYTENALKSCGQVGMMVSGGNLTQSAGLFGSNSSYTVPGLHLSGSGTIFGRSLVIYTSSGTGIMACANILNYNTVAYATAAIQGPISGKIMFLGSGTEHDPTVIVGELFYVDGKTAPTSGHKWVIKKGGLGFDCKKSMLVFGTGEAGMCSMMQQSKCAAGNLTGKHGTVSVGIAGTDKVKRRMFRYVDLNLQLQGSKSAVGKGLVIYTNNMATACGDIMTGGSMKAGAVFTSDSNSGISGSIEFSQHSPFHRTTITVALSGLQKKANGYHVHQFPIPSPKPAMDMCSAANVGGHLNPFGKNTMDPSYPSHPNETVDRYEVGDVSGKFGGLKGLDVVHIVYQDSEMPLYGIHSVLGRALVIHRDDVGGSRWTCANIVPKDAVKFSARTDFTPTSDLKGYIDLEQFIQSDGVVTETGITVLLEHKNTATKTMNHNWHVHINPIGDDYKAATKRCDSVLGHYNPRNVDVKGNYSTECSPQDPLRCEVGDTSMKQAQYSIGFGKKYFVDEDLPLFGDHTVLGRSFTVHDKDGGPGRMACADIIPNVNTYIKKVSFYIKVDDVNKFNASNFINDVSKGVSISKWQIQYVKHEKKSKDDCNLKVSFFVIENRRGETANDLERKIVLHRDKIPVLKTCGGCITNPSVFLLACLSVLIMVFSW